MPCFRFVLGCRGENSDRLFLLEKCWDCVPTLPFHCGGDSFLNRRHYSFQRYNWSFAICNQGVEYAAAAANEYEHCYLTTRWQYQAFY